MSPLNISSFYFSLRVLNGHNLHTIHKEDFVGLRNIKILYAIHLPGFLIIRYD